MWDEEGLEPLGGAVTTATTITTTANTASTAHHIGSYDSDLNSIDLLNNLDSCELDDDDLMLDDDLPEDTSLHSDGDGITHIAQWRMPQLCWGTQDIHNDNRQDTTSSCAFTDLSIHLDLDRDLNLDLGLGTDLGLGMDVEELADNCSAVRAQLEHLQRLLLQEGGGDNEDIEDTLTTDTLSPEDSNSSEEQHLNKQVAELLCEVQQLREDLRRRDQTIAQLTQQLTVPVVTSRCHCRETGTERRMDGHTQTNVADGGRVMLHQASQTPWREHTPQVLPSHLQPDHQGKLTRKNPGLTRPAPSAPPAKPSYPGELPRRLTCLSNDALERPVTSVHASQSSPPPPPPRDGECNGAGPAFSPSMASTLPGPTNTTQPRTRALRQPSAPRDPDNSAASGAKVRAAPPLASSLHFPKPKSQ
ncbi:unnamed protein product [Lota lota]